MRCNRQGSIVTLRPRGVLSMLSEMPEHWLAMDGSGSQMPLTGLSPVRMSAPPLLNTL